MKNRWMFLFAHLAWLMLGCTKDYQPYVDFVEPTPICSQAGFDKTCWDFRSGDILANLQKQPPWSLGSCWNVSTGSIATTPFPKQVASMASFCDSSSPPMTVTNPDLKVLQLRVDETIKLTGLGNFANVYVESPSGENPYLLDRSVREDPSGETLYDFPFVTKEFKIHLQLEIGMGAMSVDKAWQIRKFQVVGSCGPADASYECPLTLSAK